MEKEIYNGKEKVRFSGSCKDDRYKTASFEVRNYKSRCQRRFVDILGEAGIH